MRKLCLAALLSVLGGAASAEEVTVRLGQSLSEDFSDRTIMTACHRDGSVTLRQVPWARVMASVTLAPGDRAFAYGYVGSGMSRRPGGVIEFTYLGHDDCQARFEIHQSP